MDAAAEAAAGPAGQAQEAAAEAAKAAASAAPAAGFAKRKNRGNIRKRAADEEEKDDGDDGGGVVRKAAKQKDAPLGFTTKRGDRAELFAFESSNAVQQQRSDAVRSNEQETAHDRDARWVPVGWESRPGLCVRECLQCAAGAAVTAELDARGACSLLLLPPSPAGSQLSLPFTPQSTPAPSSLPPIPPHRALREQVLGQVEGEVPVSGEDGVYRGMNAYRDYRAGFRREHTVGASRWGGRKCQLREGRSVWSAAASWHGLRG